MKKRIFIVRHGETEYNKLGVVQGSGIDAHLNDTGKRQAQLFYQAFKRHPFDAVYTSALTRTQQSVSSFIDSGTQHTALKDLNEISWGDYEGKEQNHEINTAYWNIINQWRLGNIYAKTPNGESAHELAQRQIVALQHIFHQTHEKEVLVCMHGRAMKSLLCLLLNEPLHHMEYFKHSNMCLYVIVNNGEKNILMRYNDTSHLKDL